MKTAQEVGYEEGGPAFEKALDKIILSQTGVGGS